MVGQQCPFLPRGQRSSCNNKLPDQRISFKHIATVNISLFAGYFTSTQLQLSFDTRCCILYLLYLLLEYSTAIRLMPTYQCIEESRTEVVLMAFPICVHVCTCLCWKSNLLLWHVVTIMFHHKRTFTASNIVMYSCPFFQVVNETIARLRINVPVLLLG